MRGAEFLRLVRRLARKRGWHLEWRPNRGKGSHGLLLLNDRRVTVPNLKSELKKGLYFGLLRSLDIKEEDLLDD